MRGKIGRLISTNDPVLVSHKPTVDIYLPHEDLTMKPADEDRIAANLAKIMAMICIRNSRLEDLHAGTVPTTKTGDYSDVLVIDAEGREIPWLEASHINDAQMASLMRDIVNRLFTFHIKSDDPGFREDLDRWMAVAGRWDDPVLDQAFLDAMASLKSRPNS
tara:strand:- start:368 stop:853 length:486 start_codon:yes stop_codon:yes gene_type:complete